MAHHDAVTLALLALAVYRVSVIVAVDEGPFSLFAALRERVDPHQATWLGRGLRCVGCVSFWLSLIAALLIGGSILDWLALAGGVLVLHKAVNH